MSTSADHPSASAARVSDDDVERFAGGPRNRSTRRRRWITGVFVGLFVAALVLVVALGIAVTGWAWPLVVVPIVSLLFFVAPNRVAESPLADDLPVPPAAVTARRWQLERQRIADHVAHFCDFLAAAGVPGARVPSTPLDRLPPRDSNAVLVDALIDTGTDAIQRTLPQESPIDADVCRRYAVLAAGEFLVEFVPRRRAAIGELATRGHLGRDPFATLMLAYREMSASLPAGTEAYVALGRLASAGATAPSASDMRSLRNIKNSLSAGNWPEKYPDLIETGIGQSAQEHGKAAAIATNPYVDRSLRSLLEGVSLETFEKFLETRAMVGYIVNFDGTGGPLADVLTKMKTRVDDNGDPTYHVDGQPKYNFDNYYNNTRIGVVPRGVTFERFCTEFQEDFLAEYRRAAERESFRGTDVALQRLRLGQSFTVIEETGHAVEHLRAVVADVFTPEERAALLGYDSAVTTVDLLDGVLALSLPDAAVGVEGLTGHGKALGDVDEAVRRRLLSWSNEDRRGQLSVKLADDPAYADDARHELTRLILAEIDKIPEHVAEAIADNYISAFVTVGTVY